jgi:CheY-like chemotaxis protein
VLVVDDEPDVRELVTRLLEGHGAVVTAKGSASEGIDEVARTTPDVLISDIGMPDQDGFQFIKRLRSLGGPSHSTPAIALSAYARNEDRARALAAGFQSHVAKPIDERDLVMLVANLCGRA